jgi:outer membrane protein assembly factor BamB
MRRVPSAILFLLMAIATGVSLDFEGNQTSNSASVGLFTCWEYTRPQFGVFRLASDSTHVFLASQGARVDALSSDGKPLWTSELGGEIVSNIAYDPDSVYVATDRADKISTKGQPLLRSLSKNTGIPVWTIPLPPAEEHHISADAQAVFVVSDSGIVLAVDPPSGKQKWKLEVTAKFSSLPLYRGNKLYVASVRNQVFIVDVKTGTIDSVLKSTYPVTTISTSDDGRLIWGDERGNVTSLVESGSRVSWRFKSGGRVGTVLRSGEYVFVSSNDNFIYCLFAKNGNVKWKARLAGRPQNLSIVSGHALALSTESGIGIIELAKGKMVNRIGLVNEGLITGITSSGDMINVLTADAVRSYSIVSCGQIETVPSGSKAP